MNAETQRVGIVILVPMVGRKKSDNQLTEDDQTRLFGFRAAHVFEVSLQEDRIAYAADETQTPDGPALGNAVR